MDKNLACFLLILLSLSFFSCSKGESEENKILAGINNYELTYDEFQLQLAQELDRDLKLTKEIREEFLEQLIRKEVLIQEAVRLKLDRKEKFVRAIERYWESTLIRDLLETKGKEISQRILIPQETIAAHYAEMKKKDETLLHLSKLQDEISKELKEMEKTRMLREWINGLEKKANIHINQKLLSKD